MVVDTLDRVGSVSSLQELVGLASSVFEPMDLDVDIVDLAVDERAGVFAAALALTPSLQDRLDLGERQPR